MAYEREQPDPELIRLYPHLVPWPLAPNLTSAALAAKNLRLELKKEFPGIKFRTRSQNYTGGSSVRAFAEVYGVDGYTQEQAMEIASRARALGSKFTYGSFDGMTDSYNYADDEDTRKFNDTFGAAGFVFVDVSFEPEPTDPKVIKRREERARKLAQKQNKQAPRRAKP